MEILSSRVLLRPADHDTTLAFYRDVLGLAIARSMVEMHGGALRIRSLPGRGTIVMVHLPGPPPPLSAPRLAYARPAPLPQSGPSHSPRRIIGASSKEHVA